MPQYVLEFEKPIVELENKIKELKEVALFHGDEMTDDILKLEKKLESMKKKIYGNLTPWQRVLLARHPERPYTLDYIRMIFKDFVELHGDRAFGDDKAIVGGFGSIDDYKFMIIGEEKGRGTNEKIKRNFGMPHPEGYRKALRLMKMAEKFNLPIITFVDTPGAFPGIGAEERGQGEAIAVNLREMAVLRVPIIVVIIGEGASGGALAIAVGDKILMLENAWYSVISPEGCAAILFSDRQKADIMAEQLKLTADDLLKLKVIDEKIPEPLGGAHKNPEYTASKIKEAIIRNLQTLLDLPKDVLIEKRIEKYAQLGEFVEK